MSKWHPTLLWPNGWMDEDATWYGSIDLRANRIVLGGFPALRKRGTAPPPPPIRPMSVVATVAHLTAELLLGTYLLDFTVRFFVSDIIDLAIFYSGKI